MALDPGKLKYLAEIKQRLEFGNKEHGNRFLTLSAPVIIKEIKEEVTDMAAWAYSLWARTEEFNKQFEKFAWILTKTKKPDTGQFILSYDPDSRQSAVFAPYQNEELYKWWVTLPKIY